MIETPFSADTLTSFRVRFSGMPSAIIATARIYRPTNKLVQAMMANYEQN